MTANAVLQTQAQAHVLRGGKYLVRFDSIAFPLDIDCVPLFQLFRADPLATAIHPNRETLHNLGLLTGGGGQNMYTPVMTIEHPPSPHAV